MPVYSKLGDASMSLYLAPNKCWFISFMTAEIKAGTLAGFAFSEVGLPHPTLAKQWRVFDGKTWHSQPLVASLNVSSPPTASPI